MALKGILAVSLYELRREFRKKSFWLVLVLAVLPLPVAYLIHTLMSDMVRNAIKATASLTGFSLDRAWALVLGIEQPTGRLAGLQVMLSTASLAGWIWLIAILYGGDLLASDARDAALPLLLSRPITRLEYLLGKIATVTFFLIVLFAAAGATAYASAWIIFGSQSGLHEAILYSMLLGISALPLLLTASLLGFATRSPTVGIILGFVAYIIAQMVTSIYAYTVSGVFSAPNQTEFMYAQEKAMRLLVKLQAINPYTAGSMLAQALYAIEVHGGVYRSMTLGMEHLEFNAWSLAEISAASLVASITVLCLLNLLLLTRRDIT